MTFEQWMQAAPDEVKDWVLSFPTFINFLTAERATAFQMIGRYDGAMSEECKVAFRRHYETLNRWLGVIGDMLAKSKEKQPA